MKRLGLYLGCAVLGVVGALAGIQINNMMTTRRENSDLDRLLSGTMNVRPISSSTISSPIDFADAAAKIMPSVVAVDSMTQQTNFFGEVVQGGSKGSGVIISADGFILTNNHVIERATAIRVHLSDGRSVDAKLVGRDPRSDLAVLKITTKNLVAAEIGDSSKLRIGQWLLAAGNPLGYENTVSVGVVSSLDRTLPTQSSVILNAIQTDAAINQGNSGGALCNAQGQLVGINTAIASPSGGSVGIGFAIPINRAQRIVKDLIELGRARYGVLGIVPDSRPGLLSIPGFREGYKNELGFEPPSKGVFIGVVDPNGPAAQAGVQRYDVLLSIDGKEMADPLEFQKAMADKLPGDKLTLTYWSKGQTKTITVTLIELKNS